jgi:hypothetical protein
MWGVFALVGHVICHTIFEKSLHAVWLRLFVLFFVLFLFYGC